MSDSSHWIALSAGLLAIVLAWFTTLRLKAIALKPQRHNRPSARQPHTKPIVQLGRGEIRGSTLLGDLLTCLYYNTDPAQVFMGDGGYYFIGFNLACLCILGPLQIDSSLKTLIALAVLAIPLLDLTRVILTRLYHRKSPFKAAQRHFYHRLLCIGFSHRTTVLLIYSLFWIGSILILIAAEILNPLLLSIFPILLLATTFLRVIALPGWEVEFGLRPNSTSQPRQGLCCCMGRSVEQLNLRSTLSQR